MKTKTTITEGDIKLSIEPQDVVSKEGEIFYNPKMQVARSISVALLNALTRTWKIALPMAGTGVRAARILKEVTEQKIETIDVNDINAKTKEYLTDMCHENNINTEKLNISIKDANEFLHAATGYNYIDIDPFGSPNFLLDSALKQIGKQGILAVTATDTGALAGTYEKACQRKYWATPRRGPLQHEIGLRILARKVQLQGISKDKALRPILSYHYEHYYRIFFLVERGKEKASELFKELEGKFYYCRTCTQFYFSTEQQQCEICNKEMQMAGPLYTGSLQNEKYLKALTEEMERKKYDSEVKNVITKAYSDARIGERGFYELHEVASGLGIPIKKQQEVIDKLREQGFKVERSSFSPKAIITNAKAKDVRNAVKN